MADISDIVSELNTIATAQVGINSFEYENIFDLNTLRTNLKPMMIMQKQVGVTFPDFEKKFKDYKMIIGIYDTYKEAQQVSTSYEDKQKALEDLMEQFIREFRSRYLGETTQSPSPKEWYMQSGSSDIVTSELIEVIGNDKLVGIFNY